MSKNQVIKFLEQKINNQHQISSENGEKLQGHLKNVKKSL